jgi:hypothetical protein
MAGVRRYRDDADGLANGGEPGYRGGGEGRSDGGIFWGDPGVDSWDRILYLDSYHLVSSHLIIQRITHSIFRNC